MHADDRSLHAHAETGLDHGPLPTLGGWVFVPTDLPDDAFGAWHEDEALSPASGEPTRAERLVRLTDGPDGRVTVLVRGVVLHGNATPLALRRWHRAVRT